MLETLAIAVSVVVAAYIVKSGVVHEVIPHLHSWAYFGSFVAGILFTSMFTAVPAAAVLAELAQTDSIFAVAFFGGLGAVVGDYILFRLVRDTIAEDVRYLMKHSHFFRVPVIFRTHLSHWMLSLLGGVIIASPLPDELGLALLGVSKIKDRYFLPLVFVFNALGILAIAYFAQSIT